MASAWSCHIRPSDADEYGMKIHVQMRLDRRVVSGDAQLDSSDVMLAPRSLTTSHQSTVSIVNTSPTGHGMHFKHGNRFFFCCSKRDLSTTTCSFLETVPKAVDTRSSVIRPSIAITHSRWLCIVKGTGMSRSRLVGNYIYMDRETTAFVPSHTLERAEPQDFMITLSQWWHSNNMTMNMHSKN